MHINKDGEVIYDVGDRVTVIRNKLTPWHAYPSGHKGESLDWGDGMEEYCGKTVTIVQRVCGCKYTIKEDGGYWTWCNTFFERINCSVPELLSEDDGEIETPNITGFIKLFSVNL